MLKKGTITIDYIKMNSGKINISVNFWGLNEGEGCAYETEQEAQESIERIIQKRKEYSIKIIDKRVRQTTLC